MHRWLARLAFSFLILAAVAVWESRHAATRGHDQGWYYVAAAVLFALAVAGLRERHKRS